MSYKSLTLYQNHPFIFFQPKQFLLVYGSAMIPGNKKMLAVSLIFCCCLVDYMFYFLLFVCAETIFSSVENVTKQLVEH
jgi:hypothetical protein